MTQRTFYITTAIDYVNAKPHIGHAYEKIAADAIARHYRQRGYDVFFLTGTDEHGTKIQKSAEISNQAPKDFVDAYAATFKKTWDDLDISYNRFIRTTDADHYKVIQHIFKILLEKGDIYKKSYQGKYCTGCETFLTIKDLDKYGNCPHHHTPPTDIEEENYFFRLTAYKDKIRELISNDAHFLMPEFRKTELLNQLEGIEDISVSRSSAVVSWGIPVPNDASQTVYVWIDALSNYLTGIGYLTNNDLYNKYWPADLHLIGKDITKFHAIFWPAMLMAIDVPLPKTVFAHGFITVDEAKMSKTIGNVISPSDIIESYDLPNADAVRYYLLTCTVFGKDGNYSDQDFKIRINADLANNLGNLLNRSLNMLNKYNNGIIPKHTTPNNELYHQTKETIKKVGECFDTYQIALAAENIIQLVDSANKYIDRETPWKLIQDMTTKQQAIDVLYNVLETLRIVAILIYPYTPNLAQAMMNQLSMKDFDFNQSWNKLQWGLLPEENEILQENIQPLLLRLDSEIVGQGKKIGQIN